MFREKNADVAYEDFGANFNRDPPSVIRDPEGGGLEFFVVFETHVIVNFLEGDTHLDALAAVVYFTAKDSEFAEIRRRDRMKGHHYGVSVIERHTPDLEEAREEVEGVRLVEGAFIDLRFAVLGFDLRSFDAFGVKKVFQFADLCTGFFGADEHKWSQA